MAKCGGNEGNLGEAPESASANRKPVTTCDIANNSDLGMAGLSRPHQGGMMEVVHALDVRARSSRRSTISSGPRRAASIKEVSWKADAGLAIHVEVRFAVAEFAGHCDVAREDRLAEAEVPARRREQVQGAAVRIGAGGSSMRRIVHPPVPGLDGRNGRSCYAVVRLHVRVGPTEEEGLNRRDPPLGCGMHQGGPAVFIPAR